MSDVTSDIPEQHEPGSPIAVFECVAHMHALDPECEDCQKEITSLGAYHEQIIQKNQSLARQLGMKGRALNPVETYAMRLNMLIDMVVNDPGMRMRFEIEYQARLVKMFELGIATSPGPVAPTGKGLHILGGG